MNHTEETKNKMKEVWRLRKLNPNWRPRRISAKEKKSLSERMIGSKNPMFGIKLLGSLNGYWKGGKTISKRGGILIKNLSHPNADKQGYIKEHRLVASTVLGRPLKKNEVVHHINKNPKDNRNTNLIICTQSYHDLIHHKMRKLRVSFK